MGRINVGAEILVRVCIFVSVCIIHKLVYPYKRHISPKELHEDYKRVKRMSIAPSSVMVLLVVFLPLIFFYTHAYLKKSYVETTPAILAWTLAASINAFITEVAKLLVGRPRPDYFYRCFPDGVATEDFQCTGELRDVIEGRKSFPSGHSSFSFCSFGFISVWLCGVLGVFSRSRGHGLRVISCLLPLMLAGVVAMTRYCDNHHHWEDIVVGSAIGFFSAYFCYLQYYHPLDSEEAGQPYLTMIEESYFEDISDEEGCSKELFSDTELIEYRKNN